MANFMAVTASVGGKVKDEKAALELLEKFEWAGDLEIGVRDGDFHVYGYDWPDVTKLSNADDVYGEDGLDEFLQALALLLEEPFIMHCIGNEKCRFPLSGMEVVVYPDGPVCYKSFMTGIDEANDFYETSVSKTPQSQLARSFNIGPLFDDGEKGKEKKKKFTVHMMTSQMSWENIEAVDADDAISKVDIPSSVDLTDPDCPMSLIAIDQDEPDEDDFEE